uniref:Acyl-coenzyme A thioesterase 13 n=1 Tax=Syphacia muris TaxID=451379 RepID=A0A0N5AQ08_9BILA
MSTSRYLTLAKEIVAAFKGAKDFSRCCGEVNCFARIINAEEGHVKVELDVTNELVNPYGTLHGGCTATLVDIVTTMALTATPRAQPGVSVDLSVSYLAAAKLGETIVVDASVLRAGKMLAYTRADVFRKSDNALVAVGQHTKAFPLSQIRTKLPFQKEQ